MNPTRVAVQMSRTGRRLAAVVSGQSVRLTAADRMQDVPTTQSKAMITEFDTDVSSLGAFLAQFDRTLVSIDSTDGLRIALQDGRVVHRHPSGNAPECRFHAEADSKEAAQATLAGGLAALRAILE